MILDHRIRRNGNRHGFTLVEMLVAVALVLLMMSLFAKIFVDATSSLSQQRGIAENDQRGRRLTTTLRNDLDGRTFRDVYPFRANEDLSQSPFQLSRRSGYFEIDEGNPYDNTDDVLQLTVSTQLPTPEANSTGFFGVATTITGIPIGGTPDTSSITIPSTAVALLSLNSSVWIAGSYGSAGASNDGHYKVAGFPATGQVSLTAVFDPANPAPIHTGLTSNGSLLLSETDPDFDDGVPGNSAGMSTTAEVSYFMRNGALHRRVLLVRDDIAETEGQPTIGRGLNAFWYYNNLNSSGTSLNTNSNIYPWTFPTAPTTFWRDYDYSAFYYPGKLELSGGGTTAYGTGPIFHSRSDSMSNNNSGPQLIYDNTTNPAISYAFSLGNPAFRFGHNSTYQNAYFGYPQQASCSAGVTRFTQQECANSAFGYPGNIVNGDPASVAGLTYSGGVVTQYSGQTFRRGEDIIMHNVLSFDIKVWDPMNLSFVDIGDATIQGPFNPSKTFYDAAGNMIGGFFSNGYGGYPTSGTFTFDTWHPSVKLGTNTTVNQEPPFVPAIPTGALVQAGPNAGGAIGTRFPIQAVQISINYRDTPSNQLRQVTVVQSLLDVVVPSGE